MKIGDKVVCISKHENNTELIIGKVYTIKSFDKTFIRIGVDLSGYYHERFKKIDDNAINRLLYPEAFSEN